MRVAARLITCAIMASTFSTANAQTPVTPAVPVAPVAAPASPPAPPAAVAATATLPQGTPLKLMLNQELNTVQTRTGDMFDVTVLEDVVQQDTTVIPKGAIGHGEVIFAANRGGFGKAGMLYLALRRLELGDKSYMLDGRYREEGKDKNGATAATYFAVGVFAGFIKGKPGVINKGRELQARTGEPIEFVPGAPPPAVPAPPQPEAQAAAPAPETTAADKPKS